MISLWNPGLFPEHGTVDPTVPFPLDDSLIPQPNTYNTKVIISSSNLCIFHCCLSHWRVHQGPKTEHLDLILKSSFPLLGFHTQLIVMPMEIMNLSVSLHLILGVYAQCAWQFKLGVSFISSLADPYSTTFTAAMILSNLQPNGSSKGKLILTLLCLKPLSDLYCP